MSAQAWIPSHFLQASAAVHGVALASALAAPPSWPLAVSALLLNHLALGAAGLWPRSSLLGPNLCRLPDAGQHVCITIDDGPDPAVTPRVLEILTRYKARASFFCIGERVRRNAALAREIVAAGHGIENHSEHHFHYFSLLGPSAQRREIRLAQASISHITGIEPRHFRAPAGLRNPFLDYALHAEGLRLASWTRRGFDTRDGNPRQVYARLTRRLSPGDILLLHDGHAARDVSGKPVILSVLPALLETLAELNLGTAPLHELCAA